MGWEIRKRANGFAYTLIRIFRIMKSPEKRVSQVWNDLKELHIKEDWRHGIYEKERFIETGFDIGNMVLRFYYSVDESFFHCRAKVLEDYPVDMTSDIFILAAHFNNSLRIGTVSVNVNYGYVELHVKRDLLLPLLYKGEIYSNINSHYSIATDVYAAYQRLVTEREAPAIIFADLLRRNDRQLGNTE